MSGAHEFDREVLLQQLRGWAADLGFSRIGIAGIDLAEAEPGLTQWLERGFHGEMRYMAAHGLKRARPAELVAGTVSVITARMEYLPRMPEVPGSPGGTQALARGATAARVAHGADTTTADTAPPGHAGDWRAIEWARLADPARATVSLYARGRDYHKVLRSRLQRLSERIAQAVGPFGHRAFTDSAPVLEVELASRSGIGWRGKHTLCLDRERGSMYFLGEIYTDLPLPPTAPASAHCGSCTACIDVCPTQAITAPQRLDARRCISYLTIEHEGPIPEALRAPMGNRIYGCDDCQLVCPWNRHAVRSALPDFDVRESLADPTLLELWAWDEATFGRRTEGSAIRRIGHARWQRNVAVALGNARRVASGTPLAAAAGTALAAQREGASPLLREHIDWALAQG